MGSTFLNNKLILLGHTLVAVNPVCPIQYKKKKIRLKKTFLDDFTSLICFRFKRLLSNRANIANFSGQLRHFVSLQVSLLTTHKQLADGDLDGLNLVRGVGLQEPWSLVGEGHVAFVDTLRVLDGAVGWRFEDEGSSASSAESELLGVAVMLVTIGVIDELEVALAVVLDVPLVAPRSVLDGGDGDLGLAVWENEQLGVTLDASLEHVQVNLPVLISWGSGNNSGGWRVGRGR